MTSTPARRSLYAVNQTLRFCPNVSTSVPSGARELIVEASALAVVINGADAGVPVVGDDASFDVTLIVGTAPAPRGLTSSSTRAGGLHG